MSFIQCADPSQPGMPPYNTRLALGNCCHGLIPASKSEFSAILGFVTCILSTQTVSFCPSANSTCATAPWALERGGTTTWKEYFAQLLVGWNTCDIMEESP